MSEDTPLTLHAFPRAIVHIDGDAFFASCEQSRDPQLQGKPVVTGKERGIAASMSYEAKARGVTRGMRMFEIKRLCPCHFTHNLAIFGSIKWPQASAQS